MLVALSDILTYQSPRDKKLPPHNVQYAEFLRSAKKNLAPGQRRKNADFPAIIAKTTPNATR